MSYSVDHIGITVADIDVSAKFYAELGFGPYPPTINEAKDSWIGTMTGFPDAHLRITQIGLGKVRLELLQYLAPDGETRNSRGTNDVGNAHLGINVDDLDAEIARLSVLGAKFRSGPIVVPSGPDAGVRAVYLEDPDGNTVELVQWSPERRRERDA